MSGQVALNILAACDVEKKSASAGVPSKAKTTLGRKISHLTSNLQTSAASAAVKKLRRSSNQQASASPSSSPRLSGKWTRMVIKHCFSVDQTITAVWCDC